MSNSVQRVKVKYFRGTPFKLENTTDGEWVSVINNGLSYFFSEGTRYFRLGFALDIPEGYEVHIVSDWATKESSGLSLAKGVEVIDNSYFHDRELYDKKFHSEDDKSLSDKDIRRELAFLFYSPIRGFLPTGTPFLKFRLVKKQPDIVFEEVESL